MGARTMALFRVVLGARPARTSGRIVLGGLDSRVTIARDGWGIPHISAGSDVDAWFGLGFCQGQDRAFQLEMLRRVVTGTVAELVGRDGLPIDRLSRRVGFGIAAEGQLAALEPDLRAAVDAFAAGVNAGMRAGLQRRPHELVFLRGKLGPYQAADAVAQLALVSFLLVSNWDVELARLRILRADGAEALTSLDPACGEAIPVGAGPVAVPRRALERLTEDVSRVQAHLGHGGGSNNWVLGPGRTAGGRPLLANDPHLSPALPSTWYLAHLACPDWAVAGAAFVGAPVIAAGHNGHVAWGITAGAADNTDLFLERVLDDGRTVAGPDGPERCAVRVERIKVRGRGAVVEEVLLTPRGPVIGPALDGEVEAISLCATWLRPRPVRGLLGARREHTVDELNQSLAVWPGPSLNVVAADERGSIGWRLIGELPRRKAGNGTLPMPAWEPGSGWEDEPVAAEDMPALRDPPEGFITTANNAPPVREGGPFLGVDWWDGFRAARIAGVLAERRDWDPASTLRLQLDVHTLGWDEIRAPVLAAIRADSRLAVALELLEHWDGNLAPTSSAASLYELLLARMTQRVVAARAPRSAEWALGRPVTALAPYQAFAMRRTAHLARLLRDQPDGWFERSSWQQQIAIAVDAALAELRLARGSDPGAWAWGEVRPLKLCHPLGARRPLDRIFNRGPLPFGGDATTVCQGSAPPADPTANPLFVPTLRMVTDVGDWEACRFVLLGGQSGNPLSPHYDDMIAPWMHGEGVPIAWSTRAVARAARHTLELAPASQP